MSTSCIVASARKAIVWVHWSRPDATGCPGGGRRAQGGKGPWSAGWLLPWSGGLASRDLLVLFGDTEPTVSGRVRRATGRPASSRQEIAGEIVDVGFDDGMWPGAVTPTRLRAGMVAASSAAVSVNVARTVDNRCHSVPRRSREATGPQLLLERPRTHGGFSAPLHDG